MLDLFGEWHCTRGSEYRCQSAKEVKCTCSCGAHNHGIKLINSKKIKSNKKMDKKEFYKDKKRERSPELDFGVWWRDGKVWPTYRVTWIENTGEIYTECGGDIEILGVLMVSRKEIEKILKGWAKACGELYSLDWLRKKIKINQIKKGGV
jgi:hypothetical protein